MTQDDARDPAASLGSVQPEQLDAIIEGLERIRVLEAEIARLRLADEERWAVSVAMGIINEGNYGWPDGTTPPQDTLRGLLQRHS